MKKVWLGIFAVAGLALAAQATLVTVAPTTSNRLTEDLAAPIDHTVISQNYVSTWDSSRNSSKNCYTVMFTDYSAFETALVAQLGALGAGESYQINSARLVIGQADRRDGLVTNADKAYAYKSTANVYALTSAAATGFDSTDASFAFKDESASTTWASGNFSTADYDSTVLATGEIQYQTTAATATDNNYGWTHFDFDSSLVQGWIDAEASDALAFTPGGSAFWMAETTSANVEWQIDATVIPEPASLGMIASVGVGVLFIRRRILM